MKSQPMLISLFLATFLAAPGALLADDIPPSRPERLKASEARAGARAAAAARDPRGTAPADELVVLETTAGEIVLDLYELKVPGHAENMKKLVRQGFYDGSPFHRVIPDFMAQGGGLWQGGGIADVGYTQAAEIVPGMTHQRGTVAAARTGDAVNPERRSSGSQFYICFKATPWLDDQYTIFGEVVSGMEVVDALTKGGPSGQVSPDQASRILRAWLKVKDGTGKPAVADKPAAAAEPAAAPLGR